MVAFQRRFVLFLLVLGLFVGIPAWIPATPSTCPAGQHDLVQPFLISFDRHEHHVIAFFAGHPDYESVEAMVTLRDGQPPLIRGVLYQHEGLQIDHFNDAELARDWEAIFAGRQAVYTPIDFAVRTVGGIPSLRLRFTTYRGEDIDLHFEGAAPPAPELGGFINPGEHAAGASLPLMWASASAAAGDATALTIDGVLFPLAGPAPGVPGGFYTRDFRIGVFRAGRLELDLLSAPGRFEPGEYWVYQDHLANLHLYEILAVDGRELTIRKTTTSPALTEEVLTAERVGRGIELRSVRVTGRRGDDHSAPPPPSAGLTLDLSTPGRFSVSLDEHADLVTGTASHERRGVTQEWKLEPVEPSWATNRTVTGAVPRHGGAYLVDNQVGDP
ncbi:hypothetical protein [Sorangium sp. So ce1153]|uniref:hypothetical protein n=1 Tax=Sorangium sp. So ce1153 TaxID=3133333 RepID=UPI003F61F8B5